MDARERAWNAIHNLLPGGWHVGALSFDPGRRAWTIVARSPQPAGRRGRPEIEGTGEDEDAALTCLALALDERRKDAKRADIRRRGRLGYFDEAKAESRRLQDRGLTGEELERARVGSPIRVALVVTVAAV